MSDSLSGTMRLPVPGWLLPVLPVALAALLAASGVPALGLALRAGFVLASAAPAGTVLLLAIGRLTGLDAAPAAPAAAMLPVLALVGALAMLGATGTPLPPHLALWSHPLFAAARALVCIGALALAGRRLRAGASRTFAGLTLAAYAWVVTPVAADWLLGGVPGHPVSAIGMMLACIQLAAACALGVLSAQGQARRDLLGILIAGVLGLWYLTYMDYVIVWFGNLPVRVPFYLARPGWLAAAGAGIGVGGTILAAASGRTSAAAIAALIGLVLFVLWWTAGGPTAVLVAAALSLPVLAPTIVAAAGRTRAHG